MAARCCSWEATARAWATCLTTALVGFRARAAWLLVSLGCVPSVVDPGLTSDVLAGYSAEQLLNFLAGVISGGTWCSRLGCSPRSRCSHVDFSRIGVNNIYNIYLKYGSYWWAYAWLSSEMQFDLCRKHYSTPAIADRYSAQQLQRQWSHNTSS